jgi:hypothetical protein
VCGAAGRGARKAEREAEADADAEAEKQNQNRTTGRLYERTADRTGRENWDWDWRLAEVLGAWSMAFVFFEK